MVNNNAKSLSESITSLKTVYAEDDIDWVKFVYDHYQLLFNTAQYVKLDKSEHYWEYYRLEDFLQDKNIDPNVAWIVLYLNQIKSRLDFKDIDSIMIPSSDTLKALRQSFMQYRSHIKSCRN